MANPYNPDGSLAVQSASFPPGPISVTVTNPSIPVLPVTDVRVTTGSVPLAVAQVPATTEILAFQNNCVHNWLPVDQDIPGEVLIAAGAPNSRHSVLGFLLTFSGGALEEDHTVQFFSNTTPLTGRMVVTPATGLFSMTAAPQHSVLFVFANLGESLRIISTNCLLRGVIVYMTEIFP